MAIRNTDPLGPWSGMPMKIIVAEPKYVRQPIPYIRDAGASQMLNDIAKIVYISSKILVYLPLVGL